MRIRKKISDNTRLVCSQSNRVVWFELLSNQMPQESLTLLKEIGSFSHLGWQCFLKNHPIKTQHQAWGEIVDQVCLKYSLLTDYCYYPLEVKGKSLFLETPCSSELTWMPPLWGLAILVPEETLQDSKEGNQSTVLPSSDTYEPWTITVIDCFLTWLPNYKLDKDNNRDAQVDERRTMRPQTYTKN